MPGFYDVQNAIMVDEADDFVFDNLEDFVVDEDDAVTQDALIVEEGEEFQPDEGIPAGEELNADDAGSMIPGSDTMWVEDVEEDAPEQNWAKDGNHKVFVQHLKDQDLSYRPHL